MSTVVSVILLLSSAVSIRGLGNSHEFQRYDGWYNNLAHPEWGTVGSRLYRKAPSNYADGVYMVDDHRPSARDISDLVFKGPDGLPNLRNATTMLAFFSQIVAYEILQATEISCPLEIHKVPVRKGDPAFDPSSEGNTMLPFTRAKYDKSTGKGLNSPREQLNDKTSWIDASFLYSTQEPWVAAMRSFVNGTLSQGDMPDYPPLNLGRIPLINPPPPQIHRLMDPERLFLLGDPRVNENPALLGFGLILYRWHNSQAVKIRQRHPDWSDHDVFMAARRWVIGTLQNIIMYEFLPALLNENNPLGPYRGYKSDLPPGISHVFAAAAFRYPHTMVPPGMFLRGPSCQFRKDVGGFSALRMCQNWWNAQDIVQQYSVDEIILGMASQLSEGEDSVVVSDLRDFLFGPMHFTRLDLVAMGIMRGRDNGLADYNTVRRTFGLPARNWSEINPQRFSREREMFAKLESLYNYDIDKLDMYVGGMLELDGYGPGELFREIIKDQFRRIRDADRFWFENRQNGLFTDDEIAEIRNTTLYDIITKTTGIEQGEIQQDVFFWHHGDPCPQPYQLNSSDLEPCVPLMRFDHFMGNEVSYIYSCIALGIIPIICIAIGYWMIKKRKRTTMFNTQTFEHLCSENESTEGQNNNNMPDIFTIHKNKDKPIEWLHENYCRVVSVYLESSGSLSLEKPRGGLLRHIEFDCINTLYATISEVQKYSGEGPFVLITLPDNCDMVLRFHSQTNCGKFLHELEAVLKSHQKQLNVRYASVEDLLSMAETKERRQEKLNHFFREAYAKAFKCGAMQDNSSPYHGVSETVLLTSLTRAEFADALGMQEDDLFVQRMFSCVARRHENKMSFHEFLQTVTKFSNGTVEQRLQIIFDMCDRENNGQVNREEFSHFLKSINIAVGVKIGAETQTDLVNTILTKSGVGGQKAWLTYKDFETFFKDVTRDQRPVGLHLRGTEQKLCLEEERESLQSFSMANEQWDCWRSSYLSKITSYIEDYRQHIACLVIFYLVCFGFFVERFWHYRLEREHSDLRRVMGYGIAITRGSAATMSFCFGIILLTICRNVLTLLRETPLNNFVPFDSAITFHKIVAITAGIFTVFHTVGHCVNFYHVATQSKAGLQCLFQEAVFSSNFHPSISFWFFGTITGVTGILLVVVMSIIYVFAAPSIINTAYHAFRLTHFLNILLYTLTIMHGLAKLTDKPKFWLFIIGPLMVFILDRLLAMRQDYRKLQILSAKLLPSDIIYIHFKRPRNFRFRSGQWVRTSCAAFSCHFNERHAFSLASAPQEQTLKMYIKAVGPWTWQLRNAIEKTQQTGSAYPVLHMDGPYGGGNQEWCTHEVAILIGGGIGVTPYASILRDLVQSINNGQYSEINCKKVYFLWICPSHKNYEWFIDALREIEELDVKRVLDVHIFVTQFFHKFDLRTTILYISEKHFRSDRGCSMFTNLRAVNHFGRPNFNLFMRYIQKKYANLDEIGVYSCGPSTLNKSIRNSCIEVNRNRDNPHFAHKYETF